MDARATMEVYMILDLNYLIKILIVACRSREIRIFIEITRKTGAQLKHTWRQSSSQNEWNHWQNLSFARSAFCACFSALLSNFPTPNVFGRERIHKQRPLRCFCLRFLCEGGLITTRSSVTASEAAPHMRQSSPRVVWRDCDDKFRHCCLSP